MDVVGDAGDGLEAVERAGQLKPDVVLMDVRMPKLGGIDATREIRTMDSHVRILMITVSDEEADVYEAIKAGASGYFLKEISPEEVSDAIRSVAAGHTRISPSMASKVITGAATIPRNRGAMGEVAAPSLTGRELEVLRLMARGLSNRDIGRYLFISENTVKNHVRNILEKLHMHSRMEAVLHAIREKILDIGQAGSTGTGATGGT